MCQCWELDPAVRQTFTEIKQSFAMILTELHGKDYMDMNAAIFSDIQKVTLIKSAYEEQPAKIEVNSASDMVVSTDTVIDM